jgi:transcriptional regulator with GAF, ATPase, and Fis domain
MTDIDPVRLSRVRREMARGARDPARTLCSASATIVGVAGAGVVLMSRKQTLGTVCVSDARTAVVEEVQYALGEGPCLDAFQSHAPVLVPDLADLEPSRWTGFRAGAMEAGVLAAFGFPLLVGATCIGALDLYHVATGALTAEQVADAEAVAYVAAKTVFTWQTIAEEDSLAWQLEQVPLHRAAVHQAAGMVSVQASVSVDDALVLLRAHAFADGRPVGEVAAEVVAGRFRIER